MKKYLYLVVALALICVVCAFYFNHGQGSNPESTASASANHEVDSHEIILKKLSPEPVKSKFTPVLLYRTTNPEEEWAQFAGSGTLYQGREGEQILTSEHLFSKEYGITYFGWRKLRPFDTEVTRGVESILHTGSKIASDPTLHPDVILLKAGQEAKEIECFSSLTHLEPEQKMMIHNLRNKKPLILTSLVSGEKVRIIGLINLNKRDKTTYNLIDYESIEGESGTGFVDEKDRIYVLKGNPHDLPLESREILKKHLGDFKGISLVYGPLDTK